MIANGKKMVLRSGIWKIPVVIQPSGGQSGPPGAKRLPNS